MNAWTRQDPLKFYEFIERRLFGCQSCVYSNRQRKCCNLEKPGYPNNLKDECNTWKKRK